VAAEAGPPLRAMLWVRKDAPADLLATQPTECLKPPTDLAAFHDVEVGRAAFRTPLLLGGQAARAGLSCESCHRAGRGNPDFQFPGASGEPGTADVTLSLFSSHRGNGVHDPKPIPDLSAAKASLKVDQSPAAGKLEPFIRGLIVEEFDGPEPPPAVLKGLAAYVRALSPAACPKAAVARVTADGLITDADRAMAAARHALSAGDGATAVLMVAAARARLGLVDERYPGQPVPRSRLAADDRRLRDVQAQIRAGAAGGGESALAWWRGESTFLRGMLARMEPVSLFDPVRLSAAGKRRLPAPPS
jgi:hypothetical protein